MRVLFVTPTLPFPVRSGTEASAAELIREFARRPDVSLTVGHFSDAVRDEGLPAANWIALPNRVRGEIRTMIAPRGVRPYYSRAARELMGRTAFDLVVAHRLHSVYAVRGLGGRRVFVLQDVVSAKADQSSNAPWLARRVRELQYWVLERWALPQFDRVHVVSPQELANVAKRHPMHLEHTVVSPMGFDVEDSLPDDAEPSDVPVCDLAYFGSLGSLRNRRAVERFAAIYDEVRAIDDRVEAAVLGADGPDAFRQQLLARGFAHVGPISDPEAALRRTKVLVNPQAEASGVKTSVLRAMGAGTACVLSAAVADTIGGQAGQHYEVAASDAEFSAIILALLADADRRDRLGTAAAAFVRSNFSWASYVDALIGA